MGYINTGTARSLKVSVDKKVGGNQVQGYPNTYDGQQSWGNVSYPTLTDTQLRQLSDTDFNTRYAAFVSYVESVEDGLDFDTDISGDGASKYDLTLCGDTTTTTEAPVSVYAFSVQYGKYPVDVCGGTSDVVYSSSSYPGVGTVLYKDISLTQKWNVTNGEHIRFMSPILHGQNAVNVSLTTGKILSITDFNCSGVAKTTTTTTACVDATITVSSNTVSGSIQTITFTVANTDTKDEKLRVSAESVGNHGTIFDIYKADGTTIIKSGAFTQQGDYSDVVLPMESSASKTFIAKIEARPTLKIGSSSCVSGDIALFECDGVTVSTVELTSYSVCSSA